MKQFKKIIFVFLLLIVGVFFSTEDVFAATTLSCTTTLRQGNKDLAVVTTLQKELNAVMKCGLVEDGSFGSLTLECVKDFQTIYTPSGVDGIVGPNTCKALNAEYLKTLNADNNSGNVENTSDLICSSSNNLKSGSKGQQVKYLQEKLNKIAGCNLGVDGSYESATRTCVINFQKQMGLTADGVVGTTTCNKLKEVYNNRVNVAFTKQGDSLTLECHNSLKRGTRGKNVLLLQKELNKVATCNLLEDGSFGGGTLDCVEKFQKKFVAPELIKLSETYKCTSQWCKDNGYYLKPLTESQVADGIAGASTCGKLNSEYLKDNNYIISKNVSIIRSSASSSAGQVAVATYGMVFRNYGASGDYYKIKYNDTYAYIKKTDVTTTAVVVDISNQTLKRYQNGKLKMDTIVITGNKSKSWDTPQGAFSVQSKARNLPLMNDSPVNFWVAFKGSSHGFHDANEWRGNSQFYETSPYRYINGGSHGCINMLENDAMLLYHNVGISTPVYVVE